MNPARDEIQVAPRTRGFVFILFKARRLRNSDEMRKIPTRNLHVSTDIMLHRYAPNDIEGLIKFRWRVYTNIL